MAKLLKYIGAGAFIPGVPASDHECSAAEAAERVKSGLYEYAELTAEEKKARVLELKAAKAQVNAQAAKAAKAEAEAAEAAKAEAERLAVERAEQTRARIAAAERALAEAKGDGTD